MGTWLIGGFAGLALLAGAWGAVSHHRAVVAERDSLAGRFARCQSANEANVLAIEELAREAAANKRQYEIALERGREAEARADQLEIQLEARSDVEIVEIVRASEGDDCAGADMPLGVRVRIDPRTYHRISDR